MRQEGLVPIAVAAGLLDLAADGGGPEPYVAALLPLFRVAFMQSLQAHGII